MKAPVNQNTVRARAAILYSLLRTCALNGVDCYWYLVDVLGKLAAGWPHQRIDELLPENWARASPVPSQDPIAV